MNFTRDVPDLHTKPQFTPFPECVWEDMLDRPKERSDITVGCQSMKRDVTSTGQMVNDNHVQIEVVITWRSVGNRAQAESE